MPYVLEQVEPAMYRVEDDCGRVRRMTRSLLASTEDGYSALCKFQSTKAVFGWRAEPRDVANGPQPDDRVRVLVRPDEWANATVDAIGMLSERPYFQLTYDDGMVVADRLSLPWDFLDETRALRPGMRMRIPLIDSVDVPIESSVEDASRTSMSLSRTVSPAALPHAVVQKEGRPESIGPEAIGPEAIAPQATSIVASKDVMRPFSCVVDAEALAVDMLSSTGTSSTLEPETFGEEDVRLARALRLQLSYA